ncbi:NTP transferase domain-containing protein [Candidatus Woesearchaeota archaeon]|nr:NTP transferase domain-containing protein [Candidatus Woesearchaeota archaeon]
MQAIILVGGNSTRMYPLTVNKHKSLLFVAGKRILEHQLDAVEGIVDEVILVVNPKTGVQIKGVFGDAYKSLLLKYVVQHEPKGTLHAVGCAQQFIKDRFFMLMGDDFYSRNDLQSLVEHKYAALACEVPNPQQFGVFVTNEKEEFINFIEKPVNPPTNLASTGAFLLDTNVFKFFSQVTPSSRGELEFGDAVKLLSKTVPIKVVRVKELWKPCSYPWDLLALNEILLAQEQPHTITHKNSVIEQNVTLKGFVSIGEGTIIKSGSYIEGPVIIGENCTIGPHALLRGSTIIGDNSKIGLCSEVKNSILGEHCAAAHHAYIGDSVVGDKVNFGKGTTTANWRHDEGITSSVYKEKLVSTGRTKFGAVIGDNVKLGCNTVINPGRKLWPNTTTMPNEVVVKDKVAE